MPILLSPAVSVTEKDMTNVIPAVATSTGAAVVASVWGPVLQPTTIDSENRMVTVFGKPAAGNAQDWFAAANFLSYSNNMLVVRPDTTNQRNAVAKQTGVILTIPVATGGTGYTSVPTVNIPAPTDAGGLQATATAVVVGGAVTAINVTFAGSGYSVVPTVTLSGGGASTPATVGTVTTGVGGVKINNDDDYNAYYASGSTTLGEWVSRYPGALGNSLTVSMADSTSFASWAYKDQFDSVPGTSTLAASKGASLDEMHIIVIDAYGVWTGVAGAALEKFSYVSKSIEGKREDGTSSYYKNVINNTSQYIRWASHIADVSATNTNGTSATTGDLAFGAAFASGPYKKLLTTGTGTITLSGTSVTGVGTSFSYLDVGKQIYSIAGVYAGTISAVTSATAATLAATTATTISGAAWATPAARTVTLVGGVDHLTVTTGQRQSAFDLFANAEQYDISLIIGGKLNATEANYVIQNVAEVRKDCMACISPQDVNTNEPIITNGADGADRIIAFKNLLTSSSYYTIDTGYKQQYDKYSDVYRWVPLNGDIAGLCARTDYTDDPWFSPAGLNRGQIKNVVKLAYNPKQAYRDNLYKANVNPVVSFPGQGTVLFGDKTGLSKPSAFDRINVRRLFIVLEKAIATASKYQLFEFNDAYTQAQFVNMVTPFLRDVKGRRGITDFLVVCDGTNNTGEVIDTNRFVGDIYIKPARSINFINLNFVATRTGVAFSEIAGTSV